MSTETPPADLQREGSDSTTEKVLARDKKRYGDALFNGISVSSALMIFVILAAVATFLTSQAIPAVTREPDHTGLQGVEAAGGFWQWVLPLAFGTVWSAVLAMAMAVPISIGIALYLSHYAPRRVARTFGYIIDLLAAIPSVVFGLWGVMVLAPALDPFYRWLNDNLSWIYFFNAWVPYGDGGDLRPNLAAGGQNMLTAALVLALMVVPIITALAREVFLQTPRLHEEASLALGATRWEMIRQTVLPFGTPGVISASMLGLGRALGETMAVAMILPGKVLISFKLITFDNPNTIAAYIAQNFPEAEGMGNHQLIAAGLVLFIITLAVNMVARAIINSRREFSGAN
ncbi:phosphate ABC transporter permease subunit PstC [Tessaracoccus oleiagri]|uniref:Phosphate transport system permease protein n=1 Tax=Tessaracoccus oleiagri TaxID=686624 RepID=A0A1G9MV26_9ACTN|nr:phosphate ABC transporter permease subunit PstC [Tessaracoccus oleiagri]SDL78122.1 phosphate ABC transporter membrane protein 1, PhoT family (TC 3.A.1.7.1) [Tessaracoccus oleiagri]